MIHDANVILRMNDLLRHVLIEYFKIGSTAEAFFKLVINNKYKKQKST